MCGWAKSASVVFIIPALFCSVAGAGTSDCENPDTSDVIDADLGSPAEDIDPSRSSIAAITGMSSLLERDVESASPPK